MFAFRKSSAGGGIPLTITNKKAMPHRLAKQMLEMIYPARCMVCAAYTDTPNGLCPDCWSRTRFISGATCKQCGMPLPGEGKDLLCDSCMTFPPAWHHGAAAVVYADGGRRMVLALKHGDRLDLAPALARWMLTPGKHLLKRADIIAPVPLHRWRLLRRKFNQSAELARHLARASGQYCLPDLLIRHRKTPSQDGLNRSERMDNQRGAFQIPKRHMPALKGKSVLLVDDVMTTGATLSACAEALFAAGAGNVDVIVLARVERDG